MLLDKAGLKLGLGCVPFTLLVSLEDWNLTLSLLSFFINHLGDVSAKVCACESKLVRPAILLQKNLCGKLIHWLW